MTDAELKSVCRSEFEKVSGFFTWCNGRWHHKRIDAELKIADQKLQAKKDASQKAVAMRRKLGQLPKYPTRRKP